MSYNEIKAYTTAYNEREAKRIENTEHMYNYFRMLFRHLIFYTTRKFKKLIPFEDILSTEKSSKGKKKGGIFSKSKEERDQLVAYLKKLENIPTK